VDGSRKREARDLKPLVIALVVLGLVFAGAIAGYRIWQTGSQQHTASQQSNGSAVAPPK
jgi:flagellar basal body-associated protein FliL